LGNAPGVDIVAGAEANHAFKNLLLEPCSFAISWASFAQGVGMDHAIARNHKVT